ncbi:hypothetical protein PGIGA_G00069670 [Pangasianodon gigas]|uniref:Uncharacterized protein n=1 Tax=Pangasianodon gigas TaxID=30993 RepID=A0ACC5X872_PANGG|nr:hypothetical protein [Pangasianodon gigas]
MTAPVPKPRTRYMLGKSLRSDSTDSSKAAQDEPETDNKTSEVTSPELNGGSCFSPADLPELKETDDTHGGDILEKYVWPASPPQSPLASDDEDIKNLSDGVKDCVTSDSSAEDCPMTPLTPQSDTFFNIQPPKEFQNSTNSESAPQVTNSQSKDTAPLKPPVPKKLHQPPTHKKPRAATIRVSRRKSSAGAGNAVQPEENSHRESAVARSSWLDVWKGRKHNVLWTTFDGQVISMWKKRLDKISEYVFHVSSITNVRQQGQRRFFIHFRKKHFEFMAHSEDVKAGWVASLLASRGREPPAPPRHHSSLMMKEPRSKVYGAICGHNLWIYNSKEDFNLGLGMTLVSMNVASVKQTGRHSFSLTTPYKTFNFSADSSRELATWLDHLNKVILSALSCSEVAQRLWSSPWNKVCADCGSPNPEWASINLLMVICEACSNFHQKLGNNRSKVRSLKMDSKEWTEPLIQLFVLYGNKAGNNVWGHNVPAGDQILPDAEQDQRAAFINAKYCSGLYRKAHPLACSQKLLNQRLCEVVCGADVEETLSLLCSGAKVLGGDCPSAITLAENAGQALQTELLRHNEFVETPDFDQQRQTKEQTRLEELHGRLDDERFLFSQETQSAACDVLDLREVISVFNQSAGETHEFEILTLTDNLTCSADTQDQLLNHMLHIIKVVMPSPLLEEDLGGVMGVSRLSLREGSGLQHAERLCEVVCGADVEETLSLLCSGAKVLGGDCPSAITLAENAGQALQTELLRHNEFVETPDFDQQRQTKEQTRLEELHGRLDDERFLFSQETQSAACDVLDLREVISVFNQSAGETHEFEILTLTDNLTCSADTQDQLLNHMLHIIKVVMPSPLLEEDLGGVMGVSRLSLREGSGLQHAEVWATIQPGEILIYPSHTYTPPTHILLNQHTRCSVCLSENTVEVTAAEKTVYLQFESKDSCSKFYSLLSSAASSPASSDRKSHHHSPYTLPAGVSGNVPPEVQRCISHITLYGLKVEGLYRCCGSVVKIAELVEKLHEAPDDVVLETNEVCVQEVAGALKHVLRNSTLLIPQSERESWVKAAAHTDVTNRLHEYRRLVKLLPPDNRVLLSTLFSHLFNVQLHSQVNKMTAQNLAVVFVPMLFEELAMNINMVHLTRELIIHHTLVFLSKDEAPVEDEMITAL